MNVLISTCRRFDKLDAAFELRNGKEPATSCIMMQLMTVLLAVCLYNLDFPSALLGALDKSLNIAK